MTLWYSVLQVVLYPLLGLTYYGGITDMDDLKANLAENCVPEAFMDMDIFDYQVFLDTRRTMMAQYIREYYESLA